MPAPRSRVLVAVATSLVLLTIGTIGAVRAGLAGADFMFDLEQARPPLARIAPTIAPAPPPRQARKVAVVIIDGLRYDTSVGLPHLEAWRAAGATSVWLQRGGALAQPLTGFWKSPAAVPLSAAVTLWAATAAGRR